MKMSEDVQHVDPCHGEAFRLKPFKPLKYLKHMKNAKFMATLLAVCVGSASAQTSAPISFTAWAGLYVGPLAQRDVPGVVDISVNLGTRAPIGGLVAKATAGSCTYDFFLTSSTATSFYTNARATSGSCFDAPVEFHYAVGENGKPQLIWLGFGKANGTRDSAPNTVGVLVKR